MDDVATRKKCGKELQGRRSRTNCSLIQINSARWSKRREISSPCLEETPVAATITEAGRASADAKLLQPCGDDG